MPAGTAMHGAQQMSDFDADKAAHMLYGMSESMYDPSTKLNGSQYSRLDALSQHIAGKCQSSTMMAPYVIRNDRPNRVCILTAIVSPKPRQDRDSDNTKTNVPE